MSTPDTERFSHRADHYAGARPGYPVAVLEELRKRGAWSPGLRVADIGCGTGLLAKLFLEAGSVVTGVEPNDAMRAVGERELRDALETGQFRSVKGTAEATSLAPGSADLVVCGQAAHWFDAARATAEFRRILQPRGHLALIWNDWRPSRQPLALAYLELIEDYAVHQISSEGRGSHELVSPFFAPGVYSGVQVSNPQRYTRSSWKARALSVSYLPQEGTPEAAEMLSRLDRMFTAHQQDGYVELHYQTHVFLGQLS